MNLFVLNIILAVIWFLLADNPTTLQFVLGFILGAAMIAIFKPVFENTRYVKTHFYKQSDYIRKLIGFIYFFLWFSMQFFVANMKIAWSVLTLSNDKIQPNIFTVDVTELSTFEVVMVSQCITLTPGTTTVEVTDDQNKIYVHAFDGAEVQTEHDYIKSGLIKNIMRFTR